MALEISCLEISVEVEDLIVWCSRGMGGSSWASHGVLSILHPQRVKSIPSPKHPLVPGAFCGTQSITQSPGCSVSRWELL